MNHPVVQNSFFHYFHSFCNEASFSGKLFDNLRIFLNKEVKTVEIRNIKVSNTISFYVEMCQISAVKY